MKSEKATTINHGRNLKTLLTKTFPETTFSVAGSGFSPGCGFKAGYKIYHISWILNERATLAAVESVYKEYEAQYDNDFKFRTCPKSR